jgi:hypothetical protein
VSSSQFFVHKNGRVPLLTTSNYKPWSVAIRHILDSVSCWEIVEGTEQSPPNNGSAAVRERYQDFKKRKSTACSLLYSSCSLDLQGHINDIWEPTTIWETLSKQADESKQRGGPINLRRQLQSETYNGEGPISAYISRILSYRDRLAHTPQKLSKDEVIAYILIGLPETWSTISTIIENQPPENQTLDDVVNTLNAHERKLATQATQTTKSASAFIGRRDQAGRVLKPYRNQKKFHRDRNQDQDSDQDDEDENECWYCLKKGHIERQCQIKKQANKKRKERQRQAGKATANIADAVIL